MTSSRATTGAAAMALALAAATAQNEAPSPPATGPLAELAAAVQAGQAAVDLDDRTALLAALERASALLEKLPAGAHPAADEVQLVVQVAALAAIAERHDAALDVLHRLARRFDRDDEADRAMGHELQCRCAATLLLAGRKDEARALFAEHLDALVALRGDADASVVDVLLGFADALVGDGDYRGADALIARAGAALAAAKTPDEAPSMLRCLELRGQTRHRLGDARGALDAFERAHRVLARTLPGDDPRLQNARQRLASAMYGLGDYHGAKALFEQILAVRSKSLPADSTLLLRTRQGFAVILQHLGELDAARALQEQILASLVARLPPEHADVVMARLNLAVTRRRLGDSEGAWQLEEAVLQTLERVRGPDDRDLQMARINAGGTLRSLGRLDRARELQEAAIASLSRTMPADHSLLQTARATLLSTCWLAGDRAEAARLVLDLAAADRHTIAAADLGPRPAGELARARSRSIVLGLSLCCDGVADDQRPLLLADLLWTSQVLRGVETRVAQRLRRACAVPRDDARARAAELAGAIERIRRADVDGDEVAAAVRDKERAEHALLALERVGAAPLPSLAAIAAALDARSAAATLITFRRRWPDQEKPGEFHSQRWIAGLVLDHGGHVTLVDLGALEPMLQRIGDLRLATQKELRQALLDPLLAAAGDVDAIYLAVDELFELLPLDALPLSSGEPVGTHVALRRVTSLLDLAALPASPWPPSPRLVAVGGLDYAAPATAPTPQKDRPVFAPLPESRAEIDGIAASFARAFGDGHSELLTGADVDAARLAAAVPQATILHLATHGRYAPTTAAADEPANAPTAFELESSDRVTDLSPLVLCGLALAGANARDAGVVTGEELLSFDLSACQLAVLSACETAQGVRRGGQGHASLHTALHGAGARFVVSSLWQVGDRATRAFMADFYDQLWAAPADPPAALWRAKMQARARGADFSEWAAWIITGR